MELRSAPSKFLSDDNVPLTLEKPDSLPLQELSSFPEKTSSSPVPAQASKSPQLQEQKQQQFEVMQNSHSSDQSSHSLHLHEDITVTDETLSFAAELSPDSTEASSMFSWGFGLNEKPIKPLIESEAKRLPRGVWGDVAGDDDCDCCSCCVVM